MQPNEPYNPSFFPAQDYATWSLIYFRRCRITSCQSHVTGLEEDYIASNEWIPPSE